MKEYPFEYRVIFILWIGAMTVGAYELGWMFWWYLGMRILAMVILGFLLMPWWWGAFERWMRK